MSSHPRSDPLDGAGEVRPARLDRPLTTGPLDPMYADDRLRRLVAQAAERAREQARAQGYAAGWAQGRKAGAEDVRLEQERIARQGQADRAGFAQQAGSALAALEAAAAATQQRQLPEWEELGEAILDSALELARAVLARELAGVDAEVVESIRVALRALGEPIEAVAEVSRQDLAVLRALPAGTLPAGVQLRLSADVPAGGAQVSDHSQVALVSLTDAVARAGEVLRG